MALLHRLGLEGRALTLAWVLIVGVLALVGYRGVARLLADDQRLAAIVVTGCLALIASPVAWTHHGFWLVLAAFVPVASAHPRAQWVVFALVIAIMTVPLPIGGWGSGGLAPLHFIAANIRGFLTIAIVLAVPMLARRSGGRLDAGQL